MTDDDPIAGIRAELLRLRRDFEAHRSMPPATNGATLDQVVRERDEAVARCDAIRAQNEILKSNVARLMCERDAARADATDAHAELKRRDEVELKRRDEVTRVTSDGKRIPLDPRPPVYRTGTLLPEGGVRCERDREALCSHFATCPKADQFSGSRRKEG